MLIEYIYALWTLSHIWGAEGIELFHAPICLGVFLSWMSARNCIPCKACVFLLLLAILNAGSLRYFTCSKIKPAQNGLPSRRPTQPSTSQTPSFWRGPSNSRALSQYVELFACVGQERPVQLWWVHTCASVCFMLVCVCVCGHAYVWWVYMSGVYICTCVCISVCVCVMLVCVCVMLVCVFLWLYVCVCFTVVWVSLWFSVCVCVSSCKCGITFRMFEERQYCRCLLF